jgi:hypothetical protein
VVDFLLCARIFGDLAGGSLGEPWYAALRPDSRACYRFGWAGV